MREVELTIQLLENFNTIVKKLEDQGYKQTRQFYMKDYYMIHSSVDLKKDNYDILKKCLLIRDIKADKSYKYLTYKNKEYDNNTIISQSKINTQIDDVEKTKKILEMADFKALFEIENNSFVFNKDDIEIAIQKIGYPEAIYIEIEATEDELTEKNDEKVKEVLRKKLDSLNLKTTGDYEVKKAIVALEKIKN